MIVDSHCHLNYLDVSAYDNQLDLLIKAAEDAGVCRFLCIGVEAARWQEVIDIAQRHDNVFATIGVHPEDAAQQVSDEKLMQWAQLPKVVGLGETGLDYYRSEEHKDMQQIAFRQHIRIGRELNKPVIVHTRNASADTLQIMREEKAETIGGVMHCFTENWSVAQEALDLGFYISISGIVTFKTATQVMEVAQKVPLERLLVETDAPFLAPVPYRGKSNEPKYLPHVVEKIAQLRGVDSALVAEATTANFQKLFLDRMK